MLTPADPPVGRIENANGSSNILLLADHAGRAVPQALGDSGVSPVDQQRHIWYDIGVEGVTRLLSKAFNAPAIYSSYSRLAVDLNRDPSMDEAMPAVSDGTIVPMNQGLSAEDRQARIDALHAPYHAQLSAFIDGMIEDGKDPVIICIHSMTDQMNGIRRPWPLSVLWEYDERLARPLINSLRAAGIGEIGDNQPYSGRDVAGTSSRWHASWRGLRHVLVEFRQDLITSDAGQKIWADHFARHLISALKEQDAMDDQTTTELEAAAFRRLIAHLRDRTDVQNIDMMNLTGFCRNCLSKWLAAEAQQRGVEMDYDSAREKVYGMPYADWKAQYQREATAEQLTTFNEGKSA